MVLVQKQVTGTFKTFASYALAIPEAHAGKLARLRIRFDTIDDEVNTSSGIFIDDIHIGASACGDGFLDTSRGEECDDGDTTDGDACASDCTLPCLSGSGASAAKLDASTNHCYAAFSTALSSTAAESACVALGGHLASIGDAAENALVQSLLPTQTVLIGAMDTATEGTFTWTSGDPFTYSNWSPNEPNNSGDEDCTQLYVDGSWNDWPCSNTAAYVCEVAQ
ncbi:Cell surface protein [Minicystis rosea]|nr:Cell surface protein [Minicystis rosea]